MDVSTINKINRSISKGISCIHLNSSYLEKRRSQNLKFASFKNLLQLKNQRPGKKPREALFIYDISFFNRIVPIGTRARGVCVCGSGGRGCVGGGRLRNSGKNKSHEFYLYSYVLFWLIILIIPEINTIDVTSLI